MSKKLLYFKLLSLFLISSGNVSAQDSHIGFCGTDLVHETFKKENPLLQKQIELDFQSFSNFRKTNFKNGFTKKAEFIEIPIVVHVISDGSPLGTGVNKSDTQVIELINEANLIFEKQAQNQQNLGSEGAIMPFKLVLAKRSPDNTTTNGINRIDGSIYPQYVNYGIDAMPNQQGLYEKTIKEKDFWDGKSYYNIYIAKKTSIGGSPAGGYAMRPQGLGHSGVGNMNDATFLALGNLGDKGVTIAHEVGHALGLKHTHGDGNTGQGLTCVVETDCTKDGDEICDTEVMINLQNYWTCQTGAINECTNSIFQGGEQNIMAYSSCSQNRFTEGQVDYVLNTFYTYRSSLLTSLALTPADGTNNIPVETCEVTGNYGYILFNEVEFNTIYRTGIIYNLYSDFTKSNNINSAYITEVTEGSSYPLSISTENTTNRRKVYVYIDYNGDGIFDADEVVLSNHDLLANVTNLSTTITIPTTAKKNTPLRMRIVGDLSNTYGNTLNVTYGPCDPRFGGQVQDYTIIVKEATSTVWNGTSWSMGKPTDTKEAIVRGDLVINNSNRITTNKFTLESGSVTVNNYGLIEAPIIENKLSADKFVVTGNNSGLFQWGDNTSAIGEFTIIQESSPMIFNDAALWSSPVKNQNLRGFSPNTLDKRFYKYNETTNKFASLFVEDPLYPNGNLENPATYNFEAGKGYHIRVGSDFPTTKPGKKHIGKFVGEVNTGIFSIPVTKNKFGYNLVGNPYPAPILADRFLDYNKDVSVLYFWTQESPLTTNGYASNNYSSYTKAGGVEAAAGGKVPNGNIAIGQGFFVEMKDNPRSLFLSNYITGWGDQVIFHKNEEGTKRVRLDLFEGTQAKNQILVTYMQGATNGVDHQIDAKLNRMFNGSTLFSIIEGNEEKYVIQGRAPFTTEDTVQLGFEAKENAPYTIKLSNTENFDDQAIYLRDKELNQVIDLTKDHYTFDALPGIYNNRFEVIYQNKTLSTTDLSKQDVTLYNTNNTLVLKSQKEITFVEVYDITGRKVLSKKSSNNQLVLSELKKNNQVLLIKVTTSDSKTTSIKTIF